MMKLFLNKTIYVNKIPSVVFSDLIIKIGTRYNIFNDGCRLLQFSTNVQTYKIELSCIRFDSMSRL